MNKPGESEQEYGLRIHKRLSIFSALLLIAVVVIFWQASVLRALRIEVEALRAGEEAPQTTILGGVGHDQEDTAVE